jgi:hypothetical protein
MNPIDVLKQQGKDASMPDAPRIKVGMPKRNCEHDWILPDAVSEEDDATQLEGRCGKCGYRESKPVVAWLNMLERMIQKLYDQERV